MFSIIPNKQLILITYQNGYVQLFCNFDRLEAFRYTLYIHIYIRMQCMCAWVRCVGSSTTYQHIIYIVQHNYYYAYRCVCCIYACHSGMLDQSELTEPFWQNHLFWNSTMTGNAGRPTAKWLPVHTHIHGTLYNEPKKKWNIIIYQVQPVQWNTIYDHI